MKIINKLLITSVFSTALLFNAASATSFAAFDDHSERFYITEPSTVSGWKNHWHYDKWMEGSTVKEGSFPCSITYYTRVTKAYCTKCGQLQDTSSRTWDVHDYTTN